MNWNNNDFKYWDIGESHNNIITLTKDKLYKIMLALILCDGTLHNSFSLEKKINSPELLYPQRYCSVVLRIRLPVGAEDDFEKISGFKLTVPRKIAIN